MKNLLVLGAVAILLIVMGAQNQVFAGGNNSDLVQLSPDKREIDDLKIQINKLNDEKYANLINKTELYTNNVNFGITVAGVFFTISALIFGFFGIIQSINITNIRNDAKAQVDAIKALHAHARLMAIKAKRKWKIAKKAAIALEKTNNDATKLGKKIVKLEKRVSSKKTSPEIKGLKSELESIREEQSKINNRFLTSFTSLSGATGTSSSWLSPAVSPSYGSTISGTGSVAGGGAGGYWGDIGMGYAGSSLNRHVICSDCGRTFVKDYGVVEQPNGGYLCNVCAGKRRT